MLVFAFVFASVFVLMLVLDGLWSVGMVCARHVGRVVLLVES